MMMRSRRALPLGAYGGSGGGILGVCWEFVEGLGGETPESE